MVRSRRESHHSDGITDQKNLQQTSATKSAKSGLMQRSKQHRYWITSSARPISVFANIDSERVKRLRQFVKADQR
jgi:hypothetical protein